MKMIRLTGKKSGEILDLVKEMRDYGWRQNVDFDFAFHNSHWDAMVGEQETYTDFTFYEEKLATMFILKWGSQ
jgi:hypothetical protein